MGTRKSAFPFILSFFVCALAGCGLLFGQKIRVQVDVSRSLNQNSPVALDVVLIYDPKILADLQKLTAKEWFEKRDQMVRDHPKDLQLEVWGWEVTPGQTVPPKTLYVPVKTMLIYPKARVLGGVVFANYASPGPHRASLAPDRNIRIRLLENDFSVEPQN